MDQKPDPGLRFQVTPAASNISSLCDGLMPKSQTAKFPRRLSLPCLDLRPITTLPFQRLLDRWDQGRQSQRPKEALWRDTSGRSVALFSVMETWTLRVYKLLVPVTGHQSRGWLSEHGAAPQANRPWLHPSCPGSSCHLAGYQCLETLVADRTAREERKPEPNCASTQVGPNTPSC